MLRIGRDTRSATAAPGREPWGADPAVWRQASCLGLRNGAATPGASRRRQPAASSVGTELPAVHTGGGSAWWTGTWSRAATRRFVLGRVRRCMDCDHGVSPGRSVKPRCRREIPLRVCGTLLRAGLGPEPHPVCLSLGLRTRVGTPGRSLPRPAPGRHARRATAGAGTFRILCPVRAGACDAGVDRAGGSSARCIRAAVDGTGAR
jgi:hypothetical protein